jgi:mRNA interferase MazF
MKRGEIVSIVLPGNMGKPRPAVIVQSDTHPTTSTVVVCPLTSTVGHMPTLRPVIDPTPENGLLNRSMIMLDKVAAVDPSAAWRVTS